MISIPTTLFAGGELGDGSPILEYDIPPFAHTYTPAISTTDSSEGYWEVVGMNEGIERPDIEATRTYTGNSPSWTYPEVTTATLWPLGVYAYHRVVRLYHSNPQVINAIDLSSEWAGVYNVRYDTGNFNLHGDPIWLTRTDHTLLDLSNLKYLTLYYLTDNRFGSIIFPESNVVPLLVDTSENAYLTIMNFTPFGSNLGGTILANDCTKLETVIFPTTNNDIRINFKNCDLRGTISFSGLLGLEDYFYLDYNTNLEYIILPSITTGSDTIYNFSVKNCTSLKTLNLSNLHNLRETFNGENLDDLVGFNQPTNMLSSEGFSYFYLNYTNISGELDITKMKINGHISIHHNSNMTDIKFYLDEQQTPTYVQLNYNGFTGLVDISMLNWNLQPNLDMSHNPDVVFIDFGGTGAAFGVSTSTPSLIDFSYCPNLVREMVSPYASYLWTFQTQSSNKIPTTIYVWHNDWTKDETDGHMHQWGAENFIFNHDWKLIDLYIEQNFHTSPPGYNSKRNDLKSKGWTFNYQ